MTSRRLPDPVQIRPKHAGETGGERGKGEQKDSKQWGIRLENARLRSRTEYKEITPAPSFATLGRTFNTAVGRAILATLTIIALGILIATSVSSIMEFGKVERAERTKLKSDLETANQKLRCLKIITDAMGSSAENTEDDAARYRLLRLQLLACERNGGAPQQR